MDVWSEEYQRYHGEENVKTRRTTTKVTNFAGGSYYDFATDHRNTRSSDITRNVSFANNRFEPSPHPRSRRLTLKLRLLFVMSRRSFSFPSKWLDMCSDEPFHVLIIGDLTPFWYLWYLFVDVNTEVLYYWLLSCRPS